MQCFIESTSNAVDRLLFIFHIFFNQGKEQQRRQSAGPSSSGESEASGVETRFFVAILGAG